MSQRRHITRREAMGRIGLVGLGLAAGACGSDGTAATTSDGDDMLDIPASCVLSPRDIEGPYFFETGLMRSEITEGRTGVPLDVRLQLVDVDDGCAPVQNAVIEIWHCDADGIYSGYDIDEGNLADAQGETFLRGFQETDRNGRVEFQTIYPGWYPIRTIHIHAMALIDGVEQVTTQLYFDQAVNDRVIETPPYDGRGPQQTRNDDDFADITGKTFALEENGDGYTASYLIGISRA